LAIVLGIVALTRPAMTMSLFVAILSIYLLCDGVVTVFSAFHAASRGYTFWPYLLEGVVSAGVGVLGLVRPGPIAMIMLVLIAARALIVGVIEIGTGLSARRISSTTMFLLGLAGVASVAFGLLLLGRPSVGVFALAWSFGIYAIAFGLLLDVQALRGRRATGGFEREAV
jgi:uncharacterized membrane protein HdeD (DUF308 family)